MTPRHLAWFLLPFGLSACGLAPTPPASPAASTQLTAEAIGPAEYVELSAKALAEALRQHDQATVATFTQFAVGPDPDPASTRQIASRALSLASTAGGATREAVLKVARGVGPTSQVAPTAIRFPQDEGAHLGALTEWWYVNGHLRSAAGQRLGFEFTMFKVGPLLRFAHVGLTDQDGQKFHYLRDAIAPTHAFDTANRLDLRYGDQALLKQTDGAYALSATTGDARLALRMAPQKTPLIINGNGKIDMPEGGSSWYYSLPRLAATGHVTLGGQDLELTGLSWLDHQWGRFFVSGLRDRWDWFSLQFDDQTEYNLFAFRDRQGRPEARYVNSSDAQGQNHASTDFGLARESWWQSPVTRLFYTTVWQLQLPETHETVELAATNQDQELARRAGASFDPLPVYWEGNMNVTKTLPSGQKVPGVAYCEHFGFAKPQAD